METGALNQEQASSLYADFLKSYHQKTGHSLLLLTHDNRIDDSDSTFMEKIVAKLDGIDRDRWFYLDQTVRPGDIKYLCRLCDFTVTGRMHLGIGSLGAGTPALFYDYQGKVDGLLALFDVPDLKLNTEDLKDTETVVSKVESLVIRSSAFREKIKNRIDTIQILSRKNIAIALD